MMQEPYAESPNGLRWVQYFDKSRMEVTHPGAVDDGLWYVTNGLLAAEMITGRLQLGDVSFEERTPAAINIAGDSDDPTGPTYETMGGLLSSPPAPAGSVLVSRIDRSGRVTTDDDLKVHNVTAAYRVEVPGLDHQVASVFWAFMNSDALVYDSGNVVTAPLFPDPFYATGFPVTEAYWASVKVAGTYQDVLIQCFERRCLTFTPLSEPAWQVESGNVGLHYYRWRYGRDLVSS